MAVHGVVGWREKNVDGYILSGWMISAYSQGHWILFY